MRYKANDFICISFQTIRVDEDCKFAIATASFYKLGGARGFCWLRINIFFPGLIL
jgi:hypothetical protein